MGVVKYIHDKQLNVRTIILSGYDEFSYAQWGAGEPNNDQGNEPRMGMMYVNGSWNLYDMPDDVSQYYSSNIVGFVMEKEVVQ